MARYSVRSVADREEGKASLSNPTTWPWIRMATSLQATPALAGSRKWLRLRIDERVVNFGLHTGPMTEYNRNDERGQMVASNRTAGCALIHSLEENKR